jgi:hypothetical protein
MVNSGWVAPYVCDVRLDFAVHSGQPYGSLIQQALTKAPATCSEQRSLRAHATLPSALTQNSLTTLTTVWRNETNPSQDPFRRLTSHLKTQTPISMLHNGLVRKTDQRIDRLFHTQKQQSGIPHAITYNHSTLYSENLRLKHLSSLIIRPNPETRCQSLLQYGPVEPIFHGHLSMLPFLGGNPPSVDTYIQEQREWVRTRTSLASRT